MPNSRPAILTEVDRDLRVSWRSLRRDPVFAIVAPITLAVGIGATTAIFTVVNAVLLRPLPYPAPERMVAIWQVTPTRTSSPATSSASSARHRSSVERFSLKTHVQDRLP